MSRFLSLSLCFAVLLSLTSCPSQRVILQDAEQPVDITILQINDVYEIAPLEGGKVGGLARVASLLDQLEAENPNTIAVLAGDFLSPSFMGTLRLPNGEKIAGRQMVETLNVMGLDYATFGNHEFDLSSADQLQNRLDESEFQYVSANAYLRQDGATKRFTQRGVTVPDYAVHTFTTPDGLTVRLALVGVVLPFNQADYVAYTDVHESFAQAVKRARNEADLVLGLTHLSVDGDEALARAVPGLPLFMGGHEHEHLSRYVGSTAITKADANAKTAYIHRITFYPQSAVAKVDSELVPITAELGDEPGTKAVVNKWENELNGLVEGMGYDPQKALLDARTPLDGTEASIRNGQTNYGLLTNKAFESAWPGADVYLFNGGSLRLDDKISGIVTSYDVLRSFPYGGPIVRMNMKGSSLAQLLETGAVTNQGEGGYMQRLYAEKQGNDWYIQGKVLEADQTYHVILPEFVARGKEANLGFLEDLSYDKREHFPAEGGPLRNDIRDLVMAYMEKIKMWE